MRDLHPYLKHVNGSIGITPSQRHKGHDVDILGKRKVLYQEKEMRILSDGQKMKGTGSQ
jgi:hypothetical protein